MNDTPRRPTLLVAALVSRDLRRNPGAWRLAAVSSVLFVVLVAGSAVVSSLLEERAGEITFSVAVDDGLPDASTAASDLRARHLRPELSTTPVDDVAESRSTTAVIAADDGSTAILRRPAANTSNEALGWLLLELYDGEDHVTIEVQSANDIEEVTRDRFARTLTALVPFLALGVVTSVAAIAGSTRDRRGGEALLVLPVARSAVGAGTALGALPMAIVQISAGIVLLLLTALLPLPTLDQPTDLVLGGAPVALLTAAVLAALAAALGVMAGSAGGGSADAMGVGDLLAMPLAAIGIALLVIPDLPTNVATLAVPGLGSLLVLRDALLGDLPGAGALLATASSLGAAALLLLAAGRLMRSERNVRRL